MGHFWDFARAAWGVSARVGCRCVDELLLVNRVVQGVLRVRYS